MSVLVFSDAQTAATAAATLLGGQLIEKPSLVLGVDCSSSLVPVFQSLRAMTMNGLLSWGKATVFQLSERVREEGKEPLRAFMERSLYRSFPWTKKRCWRPTTCPTTGRTAAMALRTPSCRRGVWTWLC